MAPPVRALLDPRDLAQAQLARDLKRFDARRWLFPLKVKKMAVSPFHFLRGTAPLFHAALGQAPQLADGPPGDGWLTGDLHLENFGVYRPHTLEEEDKRTAVQFDVNDFDEAFVGPQRLDVLRLLTSAVLVARNWGLPAPAIRAAAEASLEGVLAGRNHGPPGTVPGPVRSLLDTVAARTRRQHLDARTERTPTGRRFLRGERYRSLSADQAAQAAGAFAAYVRGLPDDVRGKHPDAWKVLDVAFRVAGTGSLGVLRVAVLVAGKGGIDGSWIFDLKEEGVPSGAAFATGQAGRGADRVLTALEACLARPPRLAGTTRLDGASMLVRRLMPQEDRLALDRLAAAEREPVLLHLGALAGALHRRGARGPLVAWRAEDTRRLLDSAVTLAGLHEAAAVHYATLVRDL